MRGVLVPALSTFVAAIMVACAVVVSVTAIRLGETQRQLRRDHSVVRVQDQRIRKLVQLASAQQDVLSIQGKIIGRLATNQRTIVSLISPTVAR